MLKKIKKNKDLINRMLFTIAMMIVYKIGTALTVPGVNTAPLSESLGNSSVWSMINMLGGGALEKLSIFAMGVSPYITASMLFHPGRK